MSSASESSDSSGPFCLSCEVTNAMLRDVLEALAEKHGVPLTSAFDDGPARNFELILSLGIGHVLALDRSGRAGG